ncbi:hypothetical protein GmHk_02G004864 [Glycine max]|nr:hypothetical protein GmHk_02G004864 [Glycine max]
MGHTYAYRGYKIFIKANMSTASIKFGAVAREQCPKQPGAIEQPEAYAANIYNRPPQPQQQNQPQQNNYDLSSNRYNPGWRNHPNLRWSSTMGAHCRQTPTREGDATIWKRSNHSSRDYGFQICVVPGQCASDYMDWFFLISHPLMTPAQLADPPRQPPVTQDDTYVEPHIHEVPMPPAAGPTHAPSNVEQPRHAVEACQAIAERLEHLVNLRIVTVGTEIHEVMEDYIRIAKGVTPDGNVYVRS